MTQPPVEIEPINDKIVIERLEPVSQTSGGILIPMSAQQQQQEGLVVAVGPGKFVDFSNSSWSEDRADISVSCIGIQPRCRYAPMHVKPGDRVLFSKFAGADVELRSKKYVILTEDAIYCVMREAAAELAA